MQKLFFGFFFLISLWACQEKPKETNVLRSEIGGELLSSFVNPLQEQVRLQSPFGAIRFEAMTAPDSTLLDLAVGANGEQNLLSILPFSPFQKNQPLRFYAQTAESAYYSLSLRNEIKTEVTVTQRLVFQRFTFPTDSAGFVLRSPNPLEIRNDSLLVSQIDEHFFIAVQFSKSFFRRDKEHFYFLTPNQETILVKTAISRVSQENAIKNLVEIPDWNFELCKEKMTENWENELKKIQVQTSDKALKVRFYTQFWRALQSPVLLSDIEGSFRVDSVRYQAKGFEAYHYANSEDHMDLAPLLGLVKPEILQNIARTYLLSQKTSNYSSFQSSILGLMPVFWAEELDFEGEKMAELLKKQASETDEELSPYALYALAMFSKKLHSSSLENMLNTAKILDSQLGENLGYGTLGMRHNLQGYVGKIGGKENMSAFLDKFFAETTNEKFTNSQQYFPYLYAVIGEHWKTQANVHKLNARLSSAAVLWQMLGFYPLNTLEGVFVWGSPIFEKVSFQLSENQVVRFEAKNAKKENGFIQSIQKNGVMWEKVYFTLQDWQEMALWSFEMGNVPQKDFGSHEAFQPPSIE